MFTIQEAAMLPEIAHEELSAMLESVVQELLAEARIATPPVDAFALAAALGIVVALDDRQQGRARFVRLVNARGEDANPAILLRPDPRKERRHWSVAHEIGEYAAWRVFDRLSVDPRETSPLLRENVANQLATRLLLPGAWFSADGASCAWDLFRLKELYRTASHELIARRMLDFATPVIITVFDQRQVSFRRSNLPGRVPAPTPGEMRAWREAHQRKRTVQADEGMRTIRAWPVHEEHWRREILRTELNDVE
jgi:Zn-dependent peptidase ImmA (M78 family)